MNRNEKVYTNWLLFALVVACGVVGLQAWVEDEQLGVIEFVFDTLETSLILVGAGGVFILFQHTRRQHREQMALLQELHVAKDEGHDWRRKVQVHMDGLSKEIERQFRVWGLTEAEQEVGLMLLKGLSHKDIAALRGTAETTVRQQARSIYQKSGLQGKTGFAAYFLEDLLPAEQMRGSQGKGQPSQTASPAIADTNPSAVRAGLPHPDPGSGLKLDQTA